MFYLDAMDAMVEAMTQPTPTINQSTQNSTQAETGMDNKIYKFERILMLEEDLKSALNFKDFFL